MKYPYLILLPLITLAGCFDGDGGGNNDDTLAGQITPSGVEGLAYRTNSQTGTTDSEGEYRYYEGEPLELRAGDLVIAADIPAAPMITPMDFTPEARAFLQTPVINDEGLLSHTGREAQLLENPAIINRTRMLLALNWDENVGEDEGLDIRERVIEQLNTELALMDEEIDYNVSINQFALDEDDEKSPANQLLDKLCFAEEDDDRCDEPPTDAEIEAAPERPEDVDDRDPDITYKEDLESKRDRILEARRSLADATDEDAASYLSRELRLATTAFANQYYLAEQAANIPASDTDIKTITIKSIKGAPDLAKQKLEALSTNPEVVAVHSWDWASGTVEYFVTGDSGSEAEILVNFRTTDSYRWVKKQFRVVVE